MTQRSQECKVQVQPSRVSARIAALTVFALVLALTPHPVTPGDYNGRSAPDADDSQSRDRRHAEPRKGTLRSVRDFARKEWPLRGSPADVSGGAVLRSAGGR